MSWDVVSDLLPGLLVIYVCVGIVVATCLVIYFIHKEKLDRENFCYSIEAIIYYGPAAAILACIGLKNLIRYLWTREYREWFNRNKESFRVCWKAWRKARKNLKEFKANQKAKRDK